MYCKRGKIPDSPVGIPVPRWGWGWGRNFVPRRGRGWGWEWELRSPVSPAPLLSRIPCSGGLYRYID